MLASSRAGLSSKHADPCEPPNFHWRETRTFNKFSGSDVLYLASEDAAAGHRTLEGNVHMDQLAIVASDVEIFLKFEVRA